MLSAWRSFHTHSARVGAFARPQYLALEDRRRYDLGSAMGCLVPTRPASTAPTAATCSHNASNCSPIAVRGPFVSLVRRRDPPPTGCARPIAGRPSVRTSLPELVQRMRHPDRFRRNTTISTTRPRAFFFLYRFIASMCRWRPGRHAPPSSIPVLLLMPSFSLGASRRPSISFPGARAEHGPCASSPARWPPAIAAGVPDARRSGNAAGGAHRARQSNGCSERALLPTCPCDVASRTVGGRSLVRSSAKPLPCACDLTHSGCSGQNKSFFPWHELPEARACQYLDRSARSRLPSRP